MTVNHFHVPGEAARREYAVYLIVARHRTTKTFHFYVGKTGDNREGCNPLISRAGNHLSFNPIHSQSRNHLGNPEEFDFDFFFTSFGPYVPPAESRDGIDLVNEMERRLNVLSQEAFGEIVNPLKMSAYIRPAEREKRLQLATPDRIAQLQQLVATDEAIELRDDIAFFQAIKAQLAKTSGSQRPPEELDAAIRQLVSKAIMANEGIIDVFTAAGLKKPDISILSDQFLAEVRGLKHKNVAAELLAKLLKDEIKTRSPRNLVQSRQFSEMLKNTLNAYHNRAIATQEVIEELIKLAKQMSAATQRGKDLGLNDDEVAFYDALAANESAVKAMGNAELKVIAAELVTKVRQSVTIDWNLRDGARAAIRVMVRRILRKHGYPPDLQEEAVKTVLMQAELLCADWV